MGVNAAQATETATAAARLVQDRDHNPVVVADKHCRHHAGTLDKQAELAVQLPGQSSKAAGGLTADHLIGANLLREQLLKLTELAALQSCGTANNGNDILL